MSSWLKAAEDLFEVVDRRAKLVVSELDDQLATQSPASNGQGSQAKRKKSKTKAQKRQSMNESPNTSDSAPEQISILTSQVDVTPEIDSDAHLNDNDGTPSINPSSQPINEKQQNLEKDSTVSIPLTETTAIELGQNNADEAEASTTSTDKEAVTSTSNGELVNEIPSDGHEEHPFPLSATEVEVVDENHQVESVDAGQDNNFRDADVHPETDQNRTESSTTTAISNRETQSKVADGNEEPVIEQSKQVEHKAGSTPVKVQEQDQSKQVEHKSGSTPVKVQEQDQSKQVDHKAGSTPVKVQEQDQIEEAQGLLKTAVSTGQSKEARLARVCAGLSSRLQEYKSENAQLEELLVSERELNKSYEARIKQLQKDLSASKSDVTRIESNMVEALAAKNSEIEALVSSMDALKKQAALSEGNLASLQANMESIMRNRELSETRMMQALREELSTVERRAEEERAAHNATKMAAMEREVELEHRALEASTALARIQRIADERTAKASELEQKMALLEVECANLNQELQDMEARARRGQKKSPEEANQVIQMQAWQEEVERARQGQRDAEGKLSSLEAEMQKMRVEMAAMKRDAEHYSRQEHMELEKRYRELTDLLYYKQTQLETMASEKAAAEFHLEKELKRLQEAQVEAERSRVPRRASASWEEDAEMKALEPLPLHHRHMAGASIQLQKAAKLLDSGAVRATRFLWRYPTARLILLFYLVFVHLFLMYLLHRLQAQADNFSAREVAESMGLANTNLP
ncbi:PREDICTED: golgin candidate 1 isoform X1 [Prunus mume]|uniref:Golgin candidate 1 isoform X1 n=1 Tax=Prunus mume TaxID=102107 RepID=A0ABM0PPE1_PRUMU|nr:PREDICTED: golgin candidate 1 isoform X1 [Prunus mume]